MPPRGFRDGMGLVFFSQGVIAGGGMHPHHHSQEYFLLKRALMGDWP